LRAGLQGSEEHFLSLSQHRTLENLTEEVIMKTVFSIGLVLLATVALADGPDSDIARLSVFAARNQSVFVAYSKPQNRTYYVFPNGSRAVHPQPAEEAQIHRNMLSELGGHDAYPAISPGSDQIAFVKKRTPEFKSVEVMSVVDLSSGRATEVEALPAGVEVQQLSWSPNGDRIAVIMRHDAELKLSILHLKSAAVEDVPLPPDLKPFSVSWSPDAKQMVVCEIDPSGGLALYVFDTKTGRQRLLTLGGAPAWSPDGSAIAFRDRDACFTIKPDGTAKTFLFRKAVSFFSQQFLVGPLVWSPDMRSLIFHRTDGSDGYDRKIYVFDLKDRTKRLIYSGGRLEVVAWRLAKI
jgi:dipeptidyl aminopeptidase/acylaminoacyl peptidase